jgi:Putative metallopeptidase
VPNPLSQLRAAPALLLIALSAALPATSASAQPAREDRITVSYVEPTDPAHKLYRDVLMQFRALEGMRDRLISFRWPRPLKLEVRSCGESDSFYDDGEIVVCYEFLAGFWKSASSSARPPNVSRADALVGPFMDTFLHESAHAMFDLLKIPVLGKEEDAADLVSAYLMLQFPAQEKRGLILGAAYSYASELNVRSARDLNRPRLRLGRHAAFANEHSTPAQRLYSLLCMAYGADKELFAPIVERGYLPKDRAEMCDDEYAQIDFAYRTLIAPHLDTGP